METGKGFIQIKRQATVSQLLELLKSFPDDALLYGAHQEIVSGELTIQLKFKGQGLPVVSTGEKIPVVREVDGTEKTNTQDDQWDSFEKNFLEGTDVNTHAIVRAIKLHSDLSRKDVTDIINSIYDTYILIRDR